VDQSGRNRQAKDQKTTSWLRPHRYLTDIFEQKGGLGRESGERGKQRNAKNCQASQILLFYRRIGATSSREIYRSSLLSTTYFACTSDASPSLRFPMRRRTAPSSLQLPAPAAAFLTATATVATASNLCSSYLTPAYA